MSYRVISQTRDGHRELVVDSQDDLDEVMKVYEPVTMGSIALVISTGQLFILDGNQQWVELE